MKIYKLLAVIFFGLCSAANADVTLLEESTITNEGLYFWYPNNVKAFHYNPNISPRGDCVTVVNGYIFFSWYKGGMRDRDLMISRKKIGSGKWVTVQLPHKNTLIQPGNKWGDSHNTISVGVSKIDGTVHIFYDHHNTPLQYIVSKKNIAFAPDAEFKLANFNDTRGYLAAGEPIRITYPKITQNEKGEIIVNYRKGSAVGGNEMVHVYNGDTWTKAKQVTRGAGKPHVEVVDRNYAYGKPVYGNGDIYYAFSVRWARKKPDGVLNEGIYLAKTGPKMIDQWEDLNGKKHKLPIQDYSPFLVAMPPSNANKGSSGGPGLAVSERGDIHLTYNGRGRGNTYQSTYIRKAGESDFTRHEGTLKDGLSWNNRFYKASASGKKITISSGEPGSVNYRTELVHETNKNFGVSTYYIADGKLVMIISQDKASDKKDIYSYVFQLPTDGSTTPPDVKPPVTGPDYTPPAGFSNPINAGQTVEVQGTMDIAFGANGEFNYLRNQTEDVLCSREAFGDPLPGVVKKCFTKIVASIEPEPEPQPVANDEHCTVAAIGWETAKSLFAQSCTNFEFNKCEAQDINNERWVICGSKIPPADYMTIIADGSKTRIEAEDYSRAFDVSPDNKGMQYREGAVDIDTTTDGSSGYHVGWISSSDRLTYDVLTNEAGVYQLTLRIANAGGAVDVDVEINGSKAVQAQAIPSSGGVQVFQTEAFELGALASGSNSITFAFSGDVNFNWFELELITEDNGDEQSTDENTEQPQNGDEKPDEQQPNPVDDSSADNGDDSEGESDLGQPQTPEGEKPTDEGNEPSEDSQTDVTQQVNSKNSDVKKIGSMPVLWLFFSSLLLAATRNSRSSNI